MATRTPLLAGNWKMHGTATEAADLVAGLLDEVAGVTDRDILIAPPFPVLAGVAAQIRGSRILLAAQNMHSEPGGAFTGEVSAAMLVSVGCTHVILGHSERRQYFGETDETVSRKVAAALPAHLTPIVCVGETLEQREEDRTLDVVGTQVRAALHDLGGEAIARLVIAYEPVWAIGTGKVATPEQAEEIHAAIRSIVAEIAAPDVADRVRILYGGSVKPGNVDTLMAQPNLDGALVGGASLAVQDFARIVRFQ